MLRVFFFWDGPPNTMNRLLSTDLQVAVARVRRGEEPTAVLMAMKEELQKAGGGAEPSVGKVEAAGKKFLQDAPLPPAKRAELKKMLDEYLTMQAVLG